MQNITELRIQLLENYQQIKSGEMTVKVGCELNNTAGKVLNSLKVELEYNKMLEIKKRIAFLETTDTILETTDTIE